MKPTTSFSRLLHGGLALCLGVVCATSNLRAENRLIGCTESQDAATQALVARCGLRLSDQLQRVGATVSGKEFDVVWTPNERLASPPAVVLLLDQSASTMDKSDFGHLKSVVNGILVSEPKNVRLGVFTFSNEIRQIAPIGTAPGTSRLALQNISQNQAGISELLRSVASVLGAFNGIAADSKMLVILSDGRFADTAYSVAELSKQLQDAHITVFAVATGRSPSDLTDAQVLRRLTQDTGGEFFTAQDNRNVEGVTKTLSSYFTNGGVVSFPVTAKQTDIRAELANGKNVQFAFISRLYAPPVPQAAAEPPPPPPPEPDPDLLSRILQWASASLAHKLVTAGGLAAILLLLAFAWLGARRRRAAATELDSESAESGGAIASLKPALARLEFLDGDETSEIIHSRATRLGRQTDNDIVLKNTSVHRHHALLKQDVAGPFVIFDLETKNGVIVNGTRVKSAKLQDGDLVELGEVRMRFRVPA